MIYSRLRLIAQVFLATFLLTLFSKEVCSQSYSTPIGWNHESYEARVAALGQSTAALQNGTAYHLNPAIPLESGVISLSSSMISYDIFSGAKLYSPAISYSSGKLSYAVMMDYTSFSSSTDLFNERSDIRSSLIRFQTGYQINENFSVGGGFVHSSYDFEFSSSNRVNLDMNGTAWGVTLGAYYKNEFESDAFQFESQVGLSLNDLSEGFDFEGDTNSATNLPGQIRLGLGFDISSKMLRHDRHLFGAGIYTGLSKYLARWEYREGTSEIKSGSGFDTIFTTWNSAEVFSGSEMVNISLGEQISTSLGLELHFLETLYLRYGIIGGADYWIRPRHALGAEVDVYYLSLSISHLNYHSSDRFGSQAQDRATFIQATFRVPVDGQPRDSLLRRLLNW